jgi:hypothetical protein
MATNLTALGADATRRAEPWIEGLARAGFVAKAILYFTVGALASAAALGKGGGTTDSHGALATLFHAPFGRVLLGLIALGLVGYGVWRIIDGIADPERRGTKAKGIALRIGAVVRGLLHLALAGSAAKLALTQASKPHDHHVEWTRKVMSLPAGKWLVWGIALALFAYAGWQLYCAARAKLAKQLELGKCSAGVRRWLVGISRFGIAARGVVFGAVAVMLARAASRFDPKEAGGGGKALRELFELGRWPFLAIALGVIAYGVYQLVEARYRRIHIK